ncbi:RHS repeat-associated core domain-containing protein [Pseudomonas sp. RIT288]|jgi:insecticidal toxin complex protein TccC|uniref:RHS repeat-associated core domain-containing protein n=1 Tax=Pseudomonas sp. RIT288 TaxID=1470589 RepID=UPI000451489D|nr:RHS repeat-associated core domain-containing protein [Pseudomonas sp. RIT288]EZP33389.1 insecticidal toxin protein [Pseudomonas sp. RIT288]
MDQSVHSRTPSVNVIDGRGLSVRQVAYWREVALAPVESLITRQFHNTAGQPVEQWDPRLYGNARKANLLTIHGLSGQVLLLDSVDSGWRLSLPGLAAEVVTRWDGRGNRWSHRYDNRLRLLGIQLNDGPDTETITFGLTDADAAHNQRGQLLRKTDASGALDYRSFSLNALPLEETRTLFDGAAYTTHWRYGANGTALSQTDAAGHQQRSRYDIAGQLQQVTLKINDDDGEKDILKQARYNAEGQKIEQTLGNDVLCNWIYDAADGRLNGIKAGVPGQALRQNLQYQYDKVGNVVSLEDLTFNAVYFANQLIDGKRDFSHDSLYRLIRATGHDTPPAAENPGRPLPGDPAHHLNYTQTYTYDTGGNLIKLVHARAVGGYTRHMLIDPDSNRGVRWKEGDAPPDFTRQFDAHGNQLALQPGQNLQWNVLDELASVTLITRESALPDQERYRYSGGVRVYKHHETQGASTTHVHQVRYLPGLEIRTRETGEELHVITLPAVIGNVRCLHWRNGRPDQISKNQLRYCLEDSQNSSLIELDQDAALISHEHYYPFGGTASLTARLALEVSYKTIRYSGKELDDTGLYYYGRRYYAPWLQRWTSADPAGTVGGSNLYAMVRNNPVSSVDELGLNDRLNQKISDRTMSMFSTPSLHPLPLPQGKQDAIKQQEDEHLQKYPDAKFTKRVRSRLTAHAGAEYSDGSPENDLTITDMFNISLLDEGVEAYQSVSIYKPRNTKFPNNPGHLGILKIDAERFIPELEIAYRKAYNDEKYPIKIYRAGSETAISLQGIEYESSPLHPLTRELTRNHINSSEGFIPQGAGLPAFHAEVRVLNTVALLTPNLAENLDKLTIITQNLQSKTGGVGFPACFNCANIIVDTYKGRPGVKVPSLRIDLTHEKWKTDVMEYPG